MKYMTVLENLLAADKIIFCFRNCSIPIVVVIAVAPRWHQQSCLQRQRLERLFCSTVYGYSVSSD